MPIGIIRDLLSGRHSALRASFTRTAARAHSRRTLLTAFVLAIVRSEPSRALTGSVLEKIDGVRGFPNIIDIAANLSDDPDAEPGDRPAPKRWSQPCP